MGDRSEQPKPPAAGLVNAYAEMARRARRAGGPLAADGEDLLQDACVRVLGSEDRAASIEKPTGYLSRVVRNLTIDRGRARQRQAAFRAESPISDAIPGESPDPERQVAARERLGIVLEAVRQLPPRCREAFELHRFEGQSYAIIARRMGISPSMVEKHIAEAMMRLRRALRSADGADPE